MPPVVMLAMAPISSTGLRMAWAIGWKLAWPTKRRPASSLSEVLPVGWNPIGTSSSSSALHSGSHASSCKCWPLTGFGVPMMASARLFDCRRDAVHRDLGGELQPLRLTLAIVVRPIVVGTRQRRCVVRREVVVHQDLPAARAVHDGNVDALDVHRGQGRVRVEAAPARNLEVWVPRAAPAPQLAAGGGGGRRLGMRGNRQPLHLHPHDGIGVAFVLGALAECPLLPAEEPRRARAMWAFKVAGP